MGSQNAAIANTKWTVVTNVRLFILITFAQLKHALVGHNTLRASGACVNVLTAGGERKETRTTCQMEMERYP